MYPAVPKGCLLEGKGAQNIHPLESPDGIKNHSFGTAGWEFRMSFFALKCVLQDFGRLLVATSRLTRQAIRNLGQAGSTVVLRARCWFEPNKYSASLRYQCYILLLCILQFWCALCLTNTLFQSNLVLFIEHTWYGVGVVKSITHWDNQAVNQGDAWCFPCVS